MPNRKAKKRKHDKKKRHKAIKVWKRKEKIRKKNKEGSLVIKMIGDDNASECAILPIAELFI